MIEPKFNIGDRVRVNVLGDMFNGFLAVVREHRRRYKPHRWVYTLDFDGRDTKNGDGPFAENELVLVERAEEKP